MKTNRFMLSQNIFLINKMEDKFINWLSKIKCQPGSNNHLMMEKQ